MTASQLAELMELLSEMNSAWLKVNRSDDKKEPHLALRKDELRVKMMEKNWASMKVCCLDDQKAKMRARDLVL